MIFLPFQVERPDAYDEEVVDVEEVLAKLQEISKAFDDENKTYNDLGNKFVLLKQVDYA